MPIKPIVYVDQPLVMPRPTSDTRGLGAILTANARTLSQIGMTAGDNKAAMLQRLGALFSGYQDTNRERARQKETDAIRAAERAAAEQLARDEMAAREAERSAALAQMAEERDRRSAGAVLDATPAGVIPSSIAEIAKRFPETAARVQVRDGVPVRMRTPEEVAQAETRAATEAERSRQAEARAADDARMEAALQEAARHNRVVEATAGRQSNDPGPLETVMGPDGRPIYVPRVEAVGKTPATGTVKPASGLEKRALNFFNRAQQADNDLETMEEAVQSLDLGAQTYMQWAPNFMQTDLGQQYTQAQRAFTEARLRKDSGAAIPEQEFKNDRQTYFAQPGDSKATLEQKRRARAAVLASLGFESGQALGEFVGDPEEARRIVGDYKARAARPLRVDERPRNPEEPGAIERWERGPDGKLRKVGG